MATFDVLAKNGAISKALYTNTQQDLQNYVIYLADL